MSDPRLFIFLLPVVHHHIILLDRSYSLRICTASLFARSRILSANSQRGQVARTNIVLCTIAGPLLIGAEAASSCVSIGSCRSIDVANIPNPAIQFLAQHRRWAMLHCGLSQHVYGKRVNVNASIVLTTFADRTSTRSSTQHLGDKAGRAGNRQLRYFQENP